MSTSRDPAPSHSGPAVSAHAEIGAPPEAVWDAWARAEQVAQWFVDRAEGDAAEGAVLTWSFDAFDHRYPLRVLAARRPSLLAYSIAMPDGSRALQTVAVEAAGARTRVAVVQSGLPPDEEVHGDVASGWTIALATLAHWLEAGAPRERTHVYLARAESLERAALAPLQRTARGLERWLARRALSSSRAASACARARSPRPRTRCCSRSTTSADGAARPRC
jgi:uncharacterized protein YndB with AHSA1/START domain